MSGSLHDRILEQLMRHYDVPIMGNSYRGAYAEQMVREALGPGWCIAGNDWGPWDLERADGLRLEVKQSAALQAWSPSEKQLPLRKPNYDIGPRSGFWRDADNWVALLAPARLADIYVFAWHPVTDWGVADHRDPEQWRFYLMAECALPRKQKTISLNPLRRRAEETVYTALAEGIMAIAARLPNLKRHSLA